MACTVEHVSGFNSSLKAITYQSDPRTLIIPPFLYGHDEEYPSGMSELPLTSGTTNSVSEDLPEKVMVTEEPLKTPNEDKLIPGRFLEKRQARKRRGAPSTDSWMSGDGSGEGSEETQASKGFDKTTLGATLEVTVEPHRLQEPAGIHYDTYKMLFGLKEKPMDNPLDGSLGTAGPPKTKTRSNPSSEDHSILYGIFQLSDIACNSGSSKSPNLCGLDCSGEHAYTIRLLSMKLLSHQILVHMILFIIYAYLMSTFTNHYTFGEKNSTLKIS